MACRALLLAATLSMLVAPPASVRAQAPDATRHAAAKELMLVAGLAKQFDDVLPVLVRHLSETFISVVPDKGDEIREVFIQLSAKFVDRKGELIDQIAAVYAGQLTLDDFAAIIAFYKSSVGVKFVAVQPEVMGQAMVLGRRWAAQLSGEIEAEARRELKKRGIDL